MHIECCSLGRGKGWLFMFLLVAILMRHASRAFMTRPTRSCASAGYQNCPKTDHFRLFGFRTRGPGPNSTFAGDIVQIAHTMELVRTLLRKRHVLPSTTVRQWSAYMSAIIPNGVRSKPTTTPASKLMEAADPSSTQSIMC